MANKPIANFTHSTKTTKLKSVGFLFTTMEKRGSIALQEQASNSVKLDVRRTTGATAFRRKKNTKTTIQRQL